MTHDSMLTYDGITQPITEWALDYGILPSIIAARLQGGLSVEDAITTPMVVAKGQKLCGPFIDANVPAIPKERRPPRKPRRTASHVRQYTFDGETLTLSGWSDRTGICAATLHYRLRVGWPLHRVFGKSVNYSRGVVSNLEALVGTGVGSIAQEIPEITFSDEATKE
ncbi:MAG: hypothetical protein WBF87_15280 [Mesorhizobium sp.]